MSNAVATAPVQSVPEVKSTKPDFGKGKYSALMQEVYHDAQIVFNISAQASEKLARQVASDIGASMANQPVSIKLGKVNDNGQLTISEACKVKGVIMTNAIYALRAIKYADEAGKNGFSFGGTKWEPVKDLADYLLSL